MQPERIDSSYVGFQPESHNILAAFSLYSPKLPQDEQKLVQGLLAAVEKAPFLGRFVDMETGQLTDEARASLQKLQQEAVLAIEGDCFIIPDSARPKLNAQVRMYFKDPGIEALREAAKAAGNVWSPK